MPDPLFADPRLARIYDGMEGDRSDLDAYEAIVGELGARSVLDIGCGTGELACRLARRGTEVVALDPAVASLEVARRKPGAQKVRWIAGDVRSLPPLAVDLVVMTANVAQVFLSDDEWAAVLAAARRSLAAGGTLVFETRDPDRRDWEAWTPERTRVRRDLPGIGAVEAWCEVRESAGPFVSFRWTFRFAADGAVLSSDSTLRFRGREELVADLRKAGFGPPQIRDAPDRPGRELVLLAPRA